MGGPGTKGLTMMTGGAQRQDSLKKKNAGYDQKFLFKKNFISKY